MQFFCPSNTFLLIVNCFNNSLIIVSKVNIECPELYFILTNILFCFPLSEINSIQFFFVFPRNECFCFLYSFLCVSVKFKLFSLFKVSLCGR